MLNDIAKELQLIGHISDPVEMLVTYAKIFDTYDIDEIIRQIILTDNINAGVYLTHLRPIYVRLLCINAIELDKNKYILNIIAKGANISRYVYCFIPDDARVINKFIDLVIKHYKNVNLLHNITDLDKFISNILATCPNNLIEDNMENIKNIIEIELNSINNT